MNLTGLHLLLTYQCTFECDHCFVWGSPFQSGTMTLKQARYILEQAQRLGTVESIYFEGGEPTLFYPLLLACVQRAHSMGFEVGIVSNTYWALSMEDAVLWLYPFANLVADFSISSDLYHYDEALSQHAKFAREAAEKLGIPLGIISIAQPAATESSASIGQLPTGESSVMYRGRAAEKLAKDAPHYPWENFTTCPFEDLIEPGRLHVDPLGHLQICQGISLGNIFEEPLSQICNRYHPHTHPITAPLLDGGPAELVRRYGLEHLPAYADACHLCYRARQQLRTKFPEILTPDQVYGLGL
jgi:MoaA/NifB/PqqE/SkfB family radical SAM enzyme